MSLYAFLLLIFLHSSSHHQLLLNLSHLSFSTPQLHYFFYYFWLSSSRIHAKMDVLNSSPEGPSNKRKAERAPFFSLTTALPSDTTNTVPAAQNNGKTSSASDCTTCEGRGKLWKKLKVESYNVTRGEVTTQRRGYEKTVWLKCKECKGKGKETTEIQTRRRPKKSSKGDRDKEEAFHTAKERNSVRGRSFQDLLEAVRRERQAPTDRGCSTCAEEKPIADYGYKLTGTCSHAREICQDCMVLWVETKIGEGQWNTINCPECASLLEYSDISQILTPNSESFKLYVSSPVQSPKYIY
jgi:hypothetical protein